MSGVVCLACTSCAPGMHPAWQILHVSCDVWLSLIECEVAAGESCQSNEVGFVMVLVMV